MTKFLFWLYIFISCECTAQVNPSVQFTFVPEWGTMGLLHGKVYNTTINDHGVAVYIFVEEANGGWWTKPTASNPVTPIQPDSSFITSFITGGLDQFATRIIAFLVPLSFSPPVLLGAALPGSLLSYPYAVSCRPHGNRTIVWSGFDWIVKKSVGTTLLPIGPGPNIFNDNDTMVWVDNQQRLHLRIAKIGNTWHCSELICKSSRGYNRYDFDISSRVDQLDPNIVAGIFTWDDCSPYAQPLNNFFREIDIEFSKWKTLIPNSQYVVQPWDISGNRNRFNMNLMGIDHSLHSFDWTSDSILFISVWGDSSYSWKYTNQTYIPLPGNENLRINFWLYQATPPSDTMNAEFIVNSFITNKGYDISGNFKYNNPENTSLDNIEVFLLYDSIPVDSMITDINGFYMFHQVFNGSYRVAASSVKPWEGVNGTDAQKIQRHFAGLELFTIPVRLPAADVNNSGSINGTDALKVKRRFVGLDQSFERGDWTFAKPTGGDLVIVNGLNLTQDFHGLCVGDVNGSNIPSPGKIVKVGVDLTTDGVIKVIPGEDFELPVRVKNAMKVNAISLVIPYPGDLVEIRGILMSQGSPVFNVADNQIRIAWSELQTLNLQSGETLLTLKLRANDTFTGNRVIELNPSMESELADDTGEPIPLAELTSLSIKPLKPNSITMPNGQVNSIKVYPNPAQDNLIVEINLRSSADCGLKISDVSGKVITILTERRFEKGIGKFLVNTSDIANGIYNLKIFIYGEQGVNELLQKVIINR